jgi:CSLREA domain-containing protein
MRVARRVGMYAVMLLLISLSLTQIILAHGEGSFTVNTADDHTDGVCDEADCTLREAIENANAEPDNDNIYFAISGAGIHTIQPTSALPAITQPVTIDGRTQSGWAGKPVIELDGTSAGMLANGLTINASGVKIRGLAINRFSFAGIFITGGTGSEVSANFIGTDPTGTQALGNRDGVYIFNSSANVIGGTSAGRRNLISGNTDDGIDFEGAGAANNSVQGNYIGSDITGLLPLPNAGDGIKISNTSPDNLIGGTDIAAGNLIAFNNGRAIYAELDVTAASGNHFQLNTIFSNGGIGIDLNGEGVTLNDPDDVDTGANLLQNFPELTSAELVAGNLRLQGALNSTPSQTFRLEFFANPACDASGYGEGKIYLGFTSVSTDANGDALIDLTVPTAITAGQFVTATAGNALNGTSEFSACVPVITPSTPAVSPTMNYIRTTSVPLSWNTITWADGYALEVDNNANFSSPEYSNQALSVTARSATANLPSTDATYYWRVGAKKPDGTIQWSATQSFIVDVP